MPRKCQQLETEILRRPPKDKCGYYKIYDAAGNGFIVYCDMETEPGTAWTLIMSWSLKNNHFANFRYCYQWINPLSSARKNFPVFDGSSPLANSL